MSVKNAKRLETLQEGFIITSVVSPTHSKIGVETSIQSLRKHVTKLGN